MEKRVRECWALAIIYPNYLVTLPDGTPMFKIPILVDGYVTVDMKPTERLRNELQTMKLLQTGELAAVTAERDRLKRELQEQRNRIDTEELYPKPYDVHTL